MKKFLILLTILMLWAIQALAMDQTDPFGLPKPAQHESGPTFAETFNGKMDAAAAAINAYSIEGRYVVGKSSGCSTFAAAVATLNAAGTACTLVVPNTVAETLAADLTVNSNIHLVFQRGALLTVATTKTLTICGDITAGLYKIFAHSGTGKVSFYDGTNFVYSSAGRHLQVEWWGADPNGFLNYVNSASYINAALDSVRASIVYGNQYITLHFNGHYWVTTSINATNLTRCTLQGKGFRNTSINADLDAAYPVLDLAGFALGKVQGIHIEGSANGAQTVGILMSRTSSHEKCDVLLEDVMVDGYYSLAGIYNISVEDSCMINCGVDVWYSASPLMNPKYGVFIGGDNKDSVASAYVTPLANSLSTFRIINGYVKTAADAGAVGESVYIYNAYAVSLQSLYLAGGNATAGTGTVRINGSNLIALYDVRTEADHDAAVYIDTDIYQLSIIACTLWGENYEIYQPSNKYIKNSKLYCSGYSKNSSFGISSGNHYQIDSGAQTSTYTLTLASSVGDLIQADAYATVAITSGDASASMVLPKTVTKMAGLPGITNATTAGKAKTVNTIYYVATSGVTALAGTDNFWDCTGLSTGASEYMKVAFCINSSGTASIVAGTKAASQAAAKLPFVGPDKLVLGYVEIPNSYAGGSLSGYVFYDK